MMKAGDIIQYGNREATLVKPMTPYFEDRGQQCWEIKFKDLPCTVYRWIPLKEKV